VFQGRYKAVVVERDSYLLVLCRHIVFNPIRAGMVRTAQEYGWSSYRATAGFCAGGALLCPALTTLFRDSQGLTKAARDQLISTAHVDYGYSLLAIGRALGLHYTTVSKIVKAQMV
jgi:hypothetical protein